MSVILRIDLPMIITIDGPAGAGKSSVARALAARLGFRFLDTGAMYRAVAWMAMQRRIDWKEVDRLAELARSLKIELVEQGVLVDGQDVTRQIRASEVTRVIKYVANAGPVRGVLVELQRREAEGRSVVTEGRDQGSVVFPQAECKIFLTASPDERARRRWRDLALRGEALTFDEVLRQQNERDENDRNREVGPLVKPDDAVVVSTDGKSREEVLQELTAIVRDHLPGAHLSTPAAQASARPSSHATQDGTEP
jgi:cytidylate kinase/pantoate ligase/cytidylate kinase